MVSAASWSVFSSILTRPFTLIKSSFGFWQVGGTALVVRLRYLFGALEPTYYEAYKQRNCVPALSPHKAMSDTMIKKSLIKIKEHLGGMEEEEERFY
jgi:hypothetical protein